MMVRTVVIALVSCLVAGGVAIAQSYQGGLRGSIKDSGGVLPGVDVTLTHEQTNVKRSTVTNERVEYAFTAIDTGTFTVRAMLQDYKTVEHQGIRIATQEFLVIDLTLEVGAIEERVRVTGRAPLIERANTSQGRLTQVMFRFSW